ncbi:MAG TPA: APC family permease [Verrucomicrobiae bacterium]|jgi:basic amino acid/polyamine antiporter, APA family|nr:APC family permease [Verrucomicrobiae bacterium]
MPPQAATPSTHSKGHLLRIVGVGFGVAVSIGGTVGSGILRTPGEIAAQLRSPWLILAVWVFGGFYAFAATLSVSELATMLPREGGWYVYSREAFGEYAGFLVGCCDWMMQTVAIAYLAVAFGEFSVGLFHGLGPHTKLVSVSSVVILTLLNWIGLRVGSRAQELTSLIKAVALIAFVAACFFGLPKSVALPTSTLTTSHANLLLAVVIALQAVIVTYDGWYSAIYFMEEDLDPAKNLPRSALGGILACIAIFLLVNVALLHVLPMAQLSASQVPAADAATLIFGSRGGQFILIISVITVVSTINALLMISPRILFAMSRDRLLPQWMTSVNSGGTPGRALFASAIIVIALVLSGSFDTLIAIASFLFVTIYISGFIALLRLRVRRPELPRPFKVWGYPWTVFGVIVVSAAFLVGSIIGDIIHCLFTLILVATSYPIYLLAVKKSSSRAPETNMPRLTDVDVEAD